MYNLLLKKYQPRFKNPQLLTERERFACILEDLIFYGIFIHLYFVVFFYATQLESMSIFNAASAVLFTISFALNRHFKANLALTIVSIEIISHAWVATTIIGWEGGFHYYILNLIILIHLNPNVSTFKKSLQNLIFLLIYACLYINSNHSTSYIFVSPKGLQLLHLLNVSVFFFILAYLVNRYRKAAFLTEKHLFKVIDDLKKLSHMDALTGLWNRRKMQYFIEDYLKKNPPSEYNNYGICFIDLDNFKQFNDQFGHECGDYILKEFSYCLNALSKKKFFYGRWGGEEFILFFPRHNIAEIYQTCEKIQHYVSEKVFTYNEVHFNVTFTCGINEIQSEKTLTTSIRKADIAMFQGKREGKNQIIIFNEPAKAL